MCAATYHHVSDNARHVILSTDIIDSRTKSMEVLRELDWTNNTFSFPTHSLCMSAVSILVMPPVSGAFAPPRQSGRTQGSDSLQPDQASLLYGTPCLT